MGEKKIKKEPKEIKKSSKTFITQENKFILVSISTVSYWKILKKHWFVLLLLLACFAE